ncbi:tripartite tricarboxylate transporter TctB family protein [Pseudonocardia nantongensis]|uniref:tripartite tricarboxylate transporter TctB family protein n=1 Tax=Pseudonocardia nantongensis TaxID=1181885 RepID=UPI0039784C45
MTRPSGSARTPATDEPADPGPPVERTGAAAAADGDLPADDADGPEEETAPPAGPVTNLVVAAVVVALGVAAAVGATALGLGTPAEPGPGTWPLIVGVLLLALGATLAGTARRSADAERFTRSSVDVLLGVVTMVVFVGVIGYIGFEIPAALLAFVWLRVLGREGWRLSAITSVAVVVAFYLVFVVGLSVDIPHLF